MKSQTNPLAIAFLAAACLVSSACQSKGSSDARAGFEKYVEAVCKCKDLACVTKEGSAYPNANSQAAKVDVRQPAEDAKRQELARKMTECTRKITIAAMARPARRGADAP